MRLPANPQELAEVILQRSTCSVQVGAVLADGHGIYAWGWNSTGPDGYGLHAEIHCLLRANRRRLGNSTLYVAGRRQRTGNNVLARPCAACRPYLTDIGRVCYRDKSGRWVDDI